MIVISGALVLVAFVLLVIGVLGPDLTFVYASIGVSLVSLVFLVIGIVQRRGEAASAPTSAPTSGPVPALPVREPAGGVTAVIPSESMRRGYGRLSPAPPPVAETVDDEDLDADGNVLIVEGRPRYHVAGCRYLSGKNPESIDVRDARDDGFSPCGVCKPDEALLSRESSTDGDVVQEEVVEEDVPGVEVAPPARRTATTRKAGAASKGAAGKAPAKAAKAPAKAAKAPAKAAKAPAKAAKAPAKAPRKAATEATGRTVAVTTPPTAPAPAAKSASRTAAKAPAQPEPAAQAPAKVAKAPADARTRAAKAAKAAKAAQAPAPAPAPAPAKAPAKTVKAPAKAPTKAAAKRAPRQGSSRG